MDAAERRRIRIDIIKSQRNKKKEITPSSSTSTVSTVEDESRMRREARRIRNRESAVASRKRKLDEYEEAQARCGMLQY